ncbi:10848_t:CDS:2, partial [Cetraspora pellucida]
SNDRLTLNQAIEILLIAEKQMKDEINVMEMECNELFRDIQSLISIVICNSSPVTLVRKINPHVAFDLQTDRIRLPIPGEQNVFITSALPYVNNVPHSGNVIWSVLSADMFLDIHVLVIIIRYSSVVLKKIWDCHKTKAQEGISCQELCDTCKNLQVVRYRIRLFWPKYHSAATDISQDIFLRLYKNDYLSEDTDARGDQCDYCGQLLNSVELMNPRCKTDNSTPITRKSNHMFLDLSKLQSKVENWIEKTSIALGENLLLGIILNCWPILEILSIA